MPASRLNIATILSRYLDAANNFTMKRHGDLCATRRRRRKIENKRNDVRETLEEHSNRWPRASMSVNYRTIGHEGLHTSVIFQTFKARRECSQHFTGANLFVSRLYNFHAFIHVKLTGRKIREKRNTCKKYYEKFKVSN